MPSVLDLLRDAVLNLFSRGARTLLTMVGVLLGLGSLVAMSGVAASMGESVVRRFDRYAATQVLLSAPGAGSSHITEADLDRVRRLEGVDGVAWVCHFGTMTVAGPWGGEPVSLDVIGASPGSMTVLEAHLAVGTDLDVPVLADKPVALVGAGVAHRLSLANPQDGASLVVDGHNLGVMGVIDDIPRLPMILNQVILPLQAAEERWGSTCTSTDIVIRTQPAWAPSVAAVARQLVTPEDLDQWTVAVPPSPDSLRQSVMTDLSVMYVVVAAISLAVGVLSIANTMSVSVLERRSEIGLRRALGYSPQGIFTLFSTEAFIIGFLGGLTGSALGCLTVIVIAIANGWPIVIGPVLALAVPWLGGVIGLLGGLGPAIRAARTSPAAALRA